MAIKNISWAPKRFTIKPTEEKGKWVLTEPVKVTWWDTETHQQVLWIPKHYVFDGASIPQAFWSLIGHPLATRSLPGALVHDFCFSNRPWLLDGSPLDFKASAELYRALLLANGMPEWKAWVHYLAVITPFARKIYHSYDHLHNGS